VDGSFGLADLQDAACQWLTIKGQCLVGGLDGAELHPGKLAALAHCQDLAHVGKEGSQHSLCDLLHGQTPYVDCALHTVWVIRPDNPWAGATPCHGYLDGALKH
jgi:hypothetical protein